MSDHDELRRLRAADPIDHDALPSPHDAQARDLFERITMTNTKLLSPRPLLLAAAAVAVAVAGGIGLASRGGDGAERSATATSTTGGGITPGGSMGSCVETYSLDTLKHREVAFDGTVSRVEGDVITFTVNRWYRGGSAATTTRAGASALGGLNSAGSGLSLSPGTRLLVAGDDEFAWSCGFTQPYDASVAQSWEGALTP